MSDFRFAGVTEAQAAAWGGERIVLGPNAAGVGRQIEGVRLPDFIEGTDSPVIAVPFIPDEIALADLAHGKPVWLLSWGGLPPVLLTTDQGMADGPCEEVS